MRVQNTWLLLGMLLCLPGFSRAQPGPVVALFDIEDKGSGLPAMFDLEQSTTELAATEEAVCTVQRLLIALRRISDKLCRPLKPKSSGQAGILKQLPLLHQPQGRRV